MASLHLRLLTPTTAIPNRTPRPLLSPPFISLQNRGTTSSLVIRASKPQQSNKAKEVEVEEVEEDLPWIQDKALDLVEFMGTVTQAIPGPRVDQSSLPWILAVPVAYVGIAFVIVVVKTVRKMTLPKAKCRRQVFGD